MNQASLSQLLIARVLARPLVAGLAACLPPGAMFSFFRKDDCEKYYKFGKTLGSGSFATVKLATCKADNEKWAVKIINKRALGPEDTEALQSEVDILKSVAKHENIVHLKENFETGDKFYMVMEVCRGGELFDRIVAEEHYSEKKAAHVVRAVASALHFIHQHNIVHRDLKPENLLYKEVDTEEIKLADFGLAHILEPQTALTTACGTPGYVAPEILMGHGYDKEVDLWSLGVITYILLCGFPPFYDDNQSELFNTIRKGRYHYPSPYWDEVSSEAKDVIDNLLKLDPTVRWTAQQVLDNPWVASEAGDKPLVHFKENMTRYNARRKFRAGIMSLQVLNFMAKGGGVSLADMVEKSAAIAAGDPPAEAK